MELRRDLGLGSLTLTVVTGTIGSGWLFASYYAAQRLGMPVSPELPPLEVFKRLVLEGEGLAVVRVGLGEPVLAY